MPAVADTDSLEEMASIVIWKEDFSAVVLEALDGKSAPALVPCKSNGCPERRQFCTK